LPLGVSAQLTTWRLGAGNWKLEAESDLMPSTIPATSLLSLRLRNQRLTLPSFHTPADVVDWFGAVQAQDYTAAKWGVGLRMAGAADRAVEAACDAGAILRTHVLRPTWHFVTPADLRWMLELTAPRVKAACAYYLRDSGLTARVLSQTLSAIGRALEAGDHLTRAELGSRLKRGGIIAEKTSGMTLGHIMLLAELDALVCSGARRGKQSTYALVDHRAPRPTRLERDEALAALARRYFQSHGPALAADFAWWSGLTVGDARAAIALTIPALTKLSYDGREYWHFEDNARVPPVRSAFLLPNFDEYTVAYRDRSAIVDQPMPPMEALGNVLIVDGRIAGTWKRGAGGGPEVMSSRGDVRIEKARAAYARFLNL
jgi:hypothetical protein